MSLKTLWELAGATQMSATPPTRTVSLVERFAEWGLSEDDLDAKDVLRRWKKIKPRVSLFEELWYIQAATAIARAEKAKDEWTVKAKMRKYRNLCEIATDAARLVLALRGLLPESSLHGNSSLTDLIAGLNLLTEASFQATTFIPKTGLMFSASASVQEMQKCFSDIERPMRWELLQDLVWLASGKRKRWSERTLRRYLQGPRYDPRRSLWRPHLKEIREAGLFGKAVVPAGRETDPETVTDALIEYLQRPEGSQRSVGGRTSRKPAK